MQTVTHASGSPDVTRRNSKGVLFEFGDENTDGSFKITHEEDDLRVERRANGVWNLAGLLIGQASVLFGRQLKMSGAGGSAQTKDFNSNIISLLLRVPYTDAGTGEPITPLFGAKIIKESPVSAPDVFPIVSGVAGFWSPIEPRLITNFYISIGSLAPVVPLRLTVTRGISGPVVYDELFEASKFTANTEVNLPLTGGGFESGGALGNFFRLQTDVLGPPGFSVGRNLAENNTWFAFDYFELFTEILWTDRQADRIMTDINGDVISDIDGNVVLSEVA
jgi:hypothetical protein